MRRAQKQTVGLTLAVVGLGSYFGCFDFVWLDSRIVINPNIWLYLGVGGLLLFIMNWGGPPYLRTVYSSRRTGISVDLLEPGFLLRTLPCPYCGFTKTQLHAMGYLDGPFDYYPHEEGQCPYCGGPKAEGLRRLNIE